MKIGVCMKVTPDTDTRIKIQGDGDGIDPTGIKWIVSPYDAFAVEEAIQTKEAHGGEVVIFTVGDDSTITQLRSGGLALGADRAVLINDPSIVSSDALAVARALAAAIKAEGCDLVFCGKQAIDDDNVQVPGMLAELLDCGHVSFVKSFETDGTGFTAERAMAGGIVQTVQGSLPVVITAERGLNTPRYAKLPAIMKAKRKKIDKKSAGDLGLSAEDTSARVSVSQYGLPPARPAGRILQGEIDDQIQELVRLLREEVKVI